MIHRRAIVLAAAAILCITPSLRAALTLTEVLDRMEQEQRALDTVSFQFVQHLRLGDFPQEKVTGEIQVKQPKSLRVVQTSPQRQILISDGTTFWLYTPDQKQQLKGDWKAWVKRSHFPLALIDFMGTLSPEHWRSAYKVYFGGYEPPLYELRFVPLQKGPSLTLWVSEKNFLPARGVLQDEGVRADVVFKGIKSNTRLDVSLFEPRVPEGTQEIPVIF